MSSSSKHNTVPFAKKIAILPKILTQKEFRVIKILTLIIIATGSIIGINWYRNTSKILPAIGGEYIEGVVGTPKLINPILAQANEVDQDLSRLIFSGLLKQKGNTLIPDLAESYTVSTDNLTYTFILRKNALWHDGTSFNTQDVIFTVHAIQNPEYKSPLYDTFSGVRISQIDDYTIAFTLSQPFAPFPSLITFGILPQHIFENIPPATAHLADFNIKNPVGTGPFQIKSLTKDSRGVIKAYTLTRNGNFYSQPPYIERVTFRFYPDIESAIEALNNKNIDGISNVANKYHYLITEKNAVFLSFSLQQYTAIFLNSMSNKALGSVALRKALTFALDRNDIVSKVLNSQGEVIYGPILPGSIGYNPELEEDSYDPKKAETLLQEDGWKKTNATDQSKPALWQKESEILTINLTTIDNPQTRTTASLVKQYWQDIGIAVNLTIISREQLLNDVLKTRNYDALLFGNDIGNDPDPYAFWHSSQRDYPGVNLSLYGNKKVDALLEEARKISDPGERAKKYIEFQEILTNDIPAIFLYNPTYPYVINKKIKGLSTARIITAADRFNEIEKWYIKTKRKLTH